MENNERLDKKIKRYRSLLHIITVLLVTIIFLKGKLEIGLVTLLQLISGKDGDYTNVVNYSYFGLMFVVISLLMIAGLSFIKMDEKNIQTKT